MPENSNLSTLSFDEVLRFGEAYMSKLSNQTIMPSRRDSLRKELDNIIVILEEKLCSGDTWNAFVNKRLEAEIAVCDTRSAALGKELEQLVSDWRAFYWWSKTSGSIELTLTKKQLSNLRTGGKKGSVMNQAWEEFRRDKGSDPSKRVFAEELLRKKREQFMLQNLENLLSTLKRQVPHLAREIISEFRTSIPSKPFYDLNSLRINRTSLKLQLVRKEWFIIILALNSASYQVQPKGQKLCSRLNVFRNTFKIGKERNTNIVALRSAKKRLVGVASDGSQLTDLPFTIFPGGDRFVTDALNHYRKSGIVLTEENIDRIGTICTTFKPDRIAIGKRDEKGYEGYLIFLFDNLQRVIAENPLYGNATYILCGTLTEILSTLKLSRSEVRQHPSAQFVIHNNYSQWLTDLKQKFYSDKTRRSGFR